MLSIKNLEKFTNQAQTSIDNVIREYYQHLFLSSLYKQSGSERILFKGGTALRIIFHSPRYSEDLDFTGIKISEKEVERIFILALTEIENVGIGVELKESKPTSGGYLGIAEFNAYGKAFAIQIEVSLRKSQKAEAISALIENDYIPAYAIVHLSQKKIIEGKLEALFSRHKPRDFYDYFFLLSGNYPIVREKENLKTVLGLLKNTKTDFKRELKIFLPKNYLMHLRDFKKVLGQKIKTFTN